MFLILDKFVGIVITKVNDDSICFQELKNKLISNLRLEYCDFDEHCPPHLVSPCSTCSLEQKPLVSSMNPKNPLVSYAGTSTAEQVSLKITIKTYLSTRREKTQFNEST